MATNSDNPSELVDEMSKRLRTLATKGGDVPYVRVQREGKGHFGVVEKTPSEKATSPSSTAPSTSKSRKRG